jgi:type 1 fimbriae regulatory protein FimB
MPKATAALQLSHCNVESHRRGDDGRFCYQGGRKPRVNGEPARPARPREKEFLTDQDMATLLEAAKRGRHGTRDHCMLLLTYRHGLRVSELIGLRWTQINQDGKQIHVIRTKGSASTYHDLLKDELKALTAWEKIRHKLVDQRTSELFINERGQPFTHYAINSLLKAIGQRAGFAFRCHPHMIRHSTAFHLADKGIDAFRNAGYLGHRNVQNSMRYVHTRGARLRRLTSPSPRHSTRRAWGSMIVGRLSGFIRVARWTTRPPCTGFGAAQMARINPSMPLRLSGWIRVLTGSIIKARSWATTMTCLDRRSLAFSPLRSQTWRRPSDRRGMRPRTLVLIIFAGLAVAELATIVTLCLATGAP